ncbi:MAG: hypothetical protein FWE62_00835 [Firmicutes bacterium]|nr:hypothetical protein [Bacillota bacterium]
MATKAYLSFGWLISVILAIIPITNLVLGIYLRVVNGKIIGAILNFFFCPVFYIVDLITVILSKKLVLLA